MSATTSHVCQSRRPALIERHPNGVHGTATKTNGQGHLIGWPALYLSGFARGPALLRDMAYQAKPTAVVSRSALRSNGAFGAHVATVLAAIAGCTGQLQTATATAMAAALLSAGKVAGSFFLGRTSCFKRAGCSGSCFKRSGCSVDCGAESVSTGDATRPRRWQCESWQTQGRCTTEQSTVAMRTALVRSVEREIILPTPTRRVNSLGLHCYNYV